MGNTQGIKIEIIGDCGPFSLLGKSIGYMFSYKSNRYLLDCGAPVFELLGFEGLKTMKGIVATHSHDDHKRWFTDLALFLRYTPGLNRSLRLITTDAVHEEWEKNSRAALERTLTNDQKKVIEVPYELFVEKVTAGPRAKYNIVSRPIDVNDWGKGMQWVVLGPDGKPASPGKAKIVINHFERANRPRLLFFDDRFNEWVEPFSYYDFTDTYFYEENKRDFTDPDTGLVIRPEIAHSWHGPPTVGIRLLSPEGENFLFTSDTVYDEVLWKELAEEKREIRLPHGLTREAFARSSILFGDINNFIERAWSRKRYEIAMRTYDNCVFLHDCYARNGVVHTDYVKIAAYHEPERLILTHTPDRFTSAHRLASVGKVFVIKGMETFEEVGGQPKEYRADFYMKDMEHRYVGFTDEHGAWKIVSDDGVLSFLPRDAESKFEFVCYVEVFHDFFGYYLPMLKEPAKQRYHMRVDGKIERITESSKGSSGVIVEDMRDEIMQRYFQTPRASTRKRVPRKIAADKT